MQVRFVSCVHCCSAERSILISAASGTVGGLAGWMGGARCARRFLTWHDAIGNRDFGLLLLAGWTGLAGELGRAE